MATITALTAREIQDSRGAPTIEAALSTQGGEGAASVPSGASVGSHEARPLSAKDAVAAVGGEIAAAVLGKEFSQKSLDQTLIALDGTPGKERLGANALLAVSIAFARAAAGEAGVPLYTYLASLGGTKPALPCPMFNLINGGKHAHNGLDIQEFLMVPTGIRGTAARVAAAEAVLAELKKTLETQGQNIEFGDEGGFAPQLESNEGALDLLQSACTSAGYSPQQVRMSLDAAASSSAQKRDAAWWTELAERYNLLSVEDPFTEDDEESFARLQAKTPVLIVGDDLTATHASAIARAARAGAIKAVILKPNQVGTVSETVDAAQAARAAGLTLIASHRSGETMDTFIADFAAGLACEYIKAGAPTKPERRQKYNRLIEIETQLSTT